MDGDRRTSSRRAFLKFAGAGSTAMLLAACGGAPSSTGPTTAPAAPAAGAATTAPAAAAPAKGGAPAADTTATISIFNFGGDADKQIYNAAYDRFKKKYPNVTIQDNFTSVTTWSEYTNKVTTQVAGGQAPDIINIAIEGTRLVVKKGLLDPLDDYLVQRRRGPAASRADQSAHARAA